MDGLDADGQGFLQVPQDVAAGAVGRRVVQQQLERLQLDQHDHVLQEVALDVGRQVWNIQELMMKEEEEGERCCFSRTSRNHRLKLKGAL